jgi:hypothetical protein
MADGIMDPCMANRLEVARQLLAELKAAYDSLPARQRREVREVLRPQKTGCAVAA